LFISSSVSCHTLCICNNGEMDDSLGTVGVCGHYKLMQTTDIVRQFYYGIID